MAMKECGAQYLKKRLIGRGGRGKVWLVENVNTNVQAVMKVYEGEQRRTEAEREIEILRKFGGRGIPYLIDCVREQGTIGIVMEYVEGKSLGCLLEERKIWSEREAAGIVTEVAGILAVFHRQVPMMVYGDLKPENIMITPEGKVYLIDFGSVLYEGEKERSVFGTRKYLPPSEGESICAYRDTYGLGVILYEMLTGCVLSEGIGNKKADISHLSKECRRIMQKAVKIHAAEGYAGGGELYEDLKKYAEGLEQEEKGRKRHMFWKKNKERKNYFICDLKRMTCTGYIRGICLIFTGLAVLGSLWKGAEVKGAAMEEFRGEETTIEHVVVRNITEDYESGGIEAEAGAESTENAAQKEWKEIKAEEDFEEEAPRDEYGRKLVVKK